ncbi:MAG: glycosyltransferase [Planctomycetes bacterium]|nr:glycosyltransferase [Planctomycetota bacterium]
MSEPLRVLQLITELRPAGAERIVFELARGLPKENFHVQVASLLPAIGAVAGWLREAGVPVHDLGMCCKYDLRARGRLVELLNRECIGLLHTHLFHANVLGRSAARKAGVRCVGTAHITERRFMPWRFWLERRALSKDGLLVCVSEAVKTFMQERAGISAQQMRVIHNGVDFSRFEEWTSPERRNEARATLRKAIDVPEFAEVAIAVGRLEPQKNYPLLLTAWAELCRSFQEGLRDQRLVIVGDGSQRESLKAQVRQLGIERSVHWLGHRDDVPALLAGADAFVHSSSYEGFGLVVVEAMAVGLPVVATAVDSIPEVLGGESAASGMLVPPNDARALASRLASLLAMQGEGRASMGASGRKRAHEKFSLERMLGDYSALYRELAK